MERHVKAVAILNICLGSIGVLGAIVVFAIFGGLAGFLSFANLEPDARFVVPLMGIIGGLVAVFVALLSLPSIIGGIGLLYFQPWARILMIVLSALNLFHVPFGTALGVYGLWTLLSKETEALFRQPVYAPVGSRPV